MNVYETVTTKLSNFYGGVYATKEGEKYFLCLDDVSFTQSIEISEEFYLAFKKEFDKE